MRPSTILAALVASPLVQGRACRPKHSSSSISIIPEEPTTATTDASIPEETYSSPAEETSAASSAIDNDANPEPTAPAEETTTVNEETPEETTTVDETPEEATTTTTAASESTPTESETDSGSWSGDVVQGNATFYGSSDLSGMHCSFSTLTLPSSMLGTAFSGSNWNNAANCGACMKVTGPNGNSINVMVVDECPECPLEHLDLWQEAFAELADLSIGVIDITYEYVECGITSPIKLLNKSGTSAYWFSMQVNNANVPVESLEFSTDGGATWTATERQTYNFFNYESGSGTDSVDVKVTSVTGKVITVAGVSIASDVETEADSNF